MRIPRDFGSIRAIRGCKGCIGAGRECRYSGARKGIGGIRGHLRLLGGVGAIRGVRWCSSVLEG